MQTEEERKANIIFDCRNKTIKDIICDRNVTIYFTDGTVLLLESYEEIGLNLFG